MFLKAPLLLQKSFNNLKETKKSNMSNDKYSQKKKEEPINVTPISVEDCAFTPEQAKELSRKLRNQNYLLDIDTFRFGDIDLSRIGEEEETISILEFVVKNEPSLQEIADKYELRLKILDYCLSPLINYELVEVIKKPRQYKPTEKGKQFYIALLQAAQKI